MPQPAQELIDEFAQRYLQATAAQASHMVEMLAACYGFAADGHDAHVRMHEQYAQLRFHLSETQRHTQDRFKDIGDAFLAVGTPCPSHPSQIPIQPSFAVRA